MNPHVKLFFGANTVFKILGLFSLAFIFPMYMKYLGVENYGLFTYIGAWGGVLSFFASFGFVEYVHAYACVEQDPYKRNSIILSGCIIVLGLSLCAVIIFLILVYGGIVVLKFDSAFIILVIIGVIIGPLSGLLGGLLTGFALMKQTYIIGLCSSILGMIITVLFVVLKATVWQIMLVGTIMGIVGLLINFAILYRKGYFSFHKFDFADYARSAIPISLVFALNTGAMMLMNFTDRYMLMYFLDTTGVGIYAMAIFMIEKIQNYIYDPIGTYMDGYIKTAVREDNRHRLQKIIDIKIYIFIVISGSVLLSYAIYGRPFLSWYLGTDFAPAHDITLLWAVVYIFYCWVLIFFNVIILQHKTANRYLMWANFAVVFLNIPINYFMIPIYGVMGAVYATCICSALVMIYTFVLVQYKYGYTIINRDSIIYMGILAVVFGVGYMLWQPTYGLILCFVFSGISALITIGVSFITKQPYNLLQFVLNKNKATT